MVNFYTLIKNIKSKSKINKILIIGKGASIEKLFSIDFSKFLVVNLNDSYKFYCGEFILINKLWSLNDLNKIKKKPIIILDKNIDYNKKNLNIYKVNFLNYSLNKILNADVHELLKSIKSFYQPLFLTGIKLAYFISKTIKKKLEVDMIGFDFSFKNKLDYTIPFLNSNKNLGIQELKKDLKNQKNILEKIVLYKNKHISVNHIGNLKFSKLNISKFCKNNNLINSTNNNKIDIVAEITTNHHGNFENLIEMVKLSKDAGADYVKIQKRDVKNFYTNEDLKNTYFSKFGSTFEDYRLGLELSMDQIDKLDKYCKYINIKWFCSVLDIKSYYDILNFKPKLIKIPSTVSGHTKLHSEIAKNYTKNIVVSTGFTNQIYENYILNKFRNCKKIFLLQCTSSYPTRFEDCNISVIRRYSFLSKKHNVIIPGYSSHEPGSTGSVMAVAAGARMLEKHVKFKKVPWSHFDNVALNLANGEFKKYVQDIRRAEVLLGSEKKFVTQNEHHKYFPVKQ
jgi:sialic acid synthase SpsE